LVAALGRATKAKGSRKNNFTFCCRLSGLIIIRETDIKYCNSGAGSPAGRYVGRASAALSRLGDEPHRLRRDALHLPARRSRQNVNLFLRKPKRRIKKLLSLSSRQSLPIKSPYVNFQEFFSNFKGDFIAGLQVRKENTKNLHTFPFSSGLCLL
jgi:hypothetical protein